MNKKTEIRIVEILFVVNNFIGIFLTFRPSLRQLLIIKGVNVSFLTLIITITYPLFLLFYFIFLRDHHKNNKFRIIFNTIFGFSIFVVILNYLLQFFEIRNYPNYVYTNYHIFLPFLSEFASYQSVITVLSLAYKYNNSLFSKRPNVGKLVSNPIYVIGILVVIILSQILYKFPAILISEIKNQIAIKNSKLDFRDTMVDLPRFASQAVFIRDNTEKDSVIVHPSQTWDFPELGNQVLIRYYLYPRTLVSPSKLNNFLSENAGGKCVMYSVLAANPDKINVYFPDYEVDASEIVYLDEDDRKHVLSNLKFNNEVYKNLGRIKIGIIKHRLCQ